MSKPIIQVEGISKSYKISHELKASMGNVSIRDGINNIVRKPIELITGHRMKKEKFWALKDINFEVNQGEVVGIIGKNGSGKSTLLKILSRITEPTTGEIRMHGRVASLLEVGTGFHPELTGRENVYFNGSILGMRKKEIESKFDEIVAFSEVEKFLDTPVKFYSSGMYVRLAFAVAAHLDPDILIIDEVLAVGDAAFQKKCLGKMREVSTEGRTVLFVSHNMDSVQSLCSRAILLKDGKIEDTGEVDKVSANYFSASRMLRKVYTDFEHSNDGAGEILLEELRLFNNSNLPTNSFSFGEDLVFEAKLNSKQSTMDFRFDVNVLNYLGTHIGVFSNVKNLHLSGNKIKGAIKRLPYAPGVYIVNVAIYTKGGTLQDRIPEAFSFEVVDSKEIVSGAHDVVYGNIDLEEL